MSAVAHFMDNRYEKIPLIEFKKKLFEEIRQCFWNFQNVIKNHFKLNILNWIEHILNLQDQNESLEIKTTPFKRRVKEETCRNKTLCNRRPYKNFEKIPVNNPPAVENMKSNEIPPLNKENEAEKHRPSHPKSFPQTTQNDSICEGLLNCVSYVHKYSLGNLSCVLTWQHA